MNRKVLAFGFYLLCMDTELARTFIEYIKEKDRAVTISEFLENTDVESTSQTFDLIWEIVDTLEQEEYITVEVELTDPENLSTMAKFFPTDGIYAETTDRIVDTIN